MNRVFHRWTTILLALFCAGVPAPARASDVDEILPLPQWSGPASLGEPPPGSPPFLGGLLFPSTLEGLDVSGASPSEPPNFASEFQSPSTEADLSLFLPDALLGKAIRPYLPPAPTSPSALRDLDENFLTFCRESPKDEHLIDPDNHVSETQKEDLLRFLQFHARDARINAYVMVTDRDQKIPANAEISNIASGALSSSDSCLAVYPLGEPSRARLFLSASIHKAAAPEYLKSVVEDCAKDAALVTDPLEQLHRFTVRLSIRLFWLEKLITSSQQALTLAQPDDEVPSDLIARREAALATALLEQNPAPARAGIQWWSVILGILVSLAGGALTYAALRHRRVRLLNYVWMLPEIEVPPRLGGAFSGGGGAWIQYR